MKTEEGVEYYGHLYNNDDLLYSLLFLTSTYTDLNNEKSNMTVDFYRYNDVNLQMGMNAVQDKIKFVSPGASENFIELSSYVLNLLNEQASAITYIDHAINYFTEIMKNDLDTMLNLDKNSAEYIKLKAEQKSLMVIIVCLRDLKSSFEKL